MTANSAEASLDREGRMYADGHRHKLRDGLPKYKHLKYADDNDDRQQIAQAVKRVLSKCNQ